MVERLNNPLKRGTTNFANSKISAPLLWMPINLHTQQYSTRYCYWPDWGTTRFLPRVQWPFKGSALSATTHMDKSCAEIVEKDKYENIFYNFLWFNPLLALISVHSEILRLYPSAMGVSPVFEDCTRNGGMRVSLQMEALYLAGSRCIHSSPYFFRLPLYKICFIF